MDLSALFKLSYGLFVLGVEADGHKNGCVINTVMQVTAEPPRLTAVVNKQNLTCDMLLKKGSFAISVLSREARLETIGRFGFRSGRDTDKFLDYAHKTDMLGNPYLAEETSARYACRVTASLDSGTHILFVGELLEAEILCADEPMTYTYYREVKKGGTSKLAPSYVAAAKKPGASNKTTVIPEDREAPAGKEIWRCSVCGYIYDGELPFAQLPASYLCPVCGQPKSVFVKIG